MDTNKLYSVTEVAQLLRVSPDTIWRWVRNKKIKVITLPNGRYRIQDTELKKIIKK